MESLFNLDLSFWEFVLFAVVGLFTGVINTLAGSGSLLTLPIFIFICGLPPSVANATNRIGVVMQSGIAAATWFKKDPLIFKGAWKLLVSASVGALVGSKIAVDLDEQMMRYSIGTLMVAMLIILLFKPQRWLKDPVGELNKSGTITAIVVMFFIGVYGGFLQAGVGVFLLAALVLVGNYSLKNANAIKLLVVFAFTVPALALFFYYGKVNLGLGLLMGVFQSIGAWFGVNFISKIPNANVWIYRILIVIVGISAIKFFV